MFSPTPRLGPRRLLGLVSGCALLTSGLQTATATASPRGDSDPASPSPATTPALATVPPDTGLEFIDTSIENASPLWYESASDGSIQVYLNYDQERSSPNRAAGHVHFLLHARPGSKLTLEFRNLENVWNGRPGSIARELQAMVISEDGVDWRAVELDALPNQRVQLRLSMTGPRLYVARVEPYRLSDLDRLLVDLRADSRVSIDLIGRTAQGRELEIVRIGDPRAPFRVFLRARAHPWEAGSNWVLEGLVRRLLRSDEQSRRWLDRYCVYFVPMANKDGVALGRTRFNLFGKDLNRDWDQPASAEFAPENRALERWLEGMIRDGKSPDLALELHNDGSGMIHLSRPPVPELPRYLERMAFLETLLRRHTWFTEGATRESFRNSGTLGDGWFERYRIDAVVHEFNCQWIAGLQQRPLARHWLLYGERLAAVLDAYFADRP